MEFTKPRCTQLRILLFPALLVMIAQTAQAKSDVPVFLLAGQSNMSGYAASSGLTTDQKAEVPNVKIYVDMTWENNGKLKKWLTLGPGFGSSASNIGPELYIGRTLSEKLPNTKIALIKVCCGSTYLGNYSSKPNDCWVPPSSNNGNAGPHYKRLLSATETALKSFNSAWDTAQYTPRIAGFVWLQGEFDGQVQSLANAYEANLTYLIKDVRKDFNVDDLPSIVIMIDVQSSWQYNSIIRAAEVAVTKKMENVDTVDTKGFDTDRTHYKAQGQVKIGTNTALRWLAMDYQYGPVVSIGGNNSGLPHEVHYQTTSFRNGLLFDLSGRKLLTSGTILPQSLPGPGVRVTAPNGHNTTGNRAVSVTK